MALVVKNPPANTGDIRDMGSVPGSEDPIEEGMAAHCSILAWRIPWTKGLGRLQSIVSQRIGHNWSNLRRRQWHPTPVLLPGKSHGWRSLEGCSPWGGWGSDTTERLHFHFSLSCIGEGNGNPLQCSCLENPRYGASWWALWGLWASMGSHRVGHDWSDSAAAEVT